MAAEPGSRAQKTPSAGPFRVVVCGEVSSGKSTLLNALLRARALPDNLGATTRPWVVLRGPDPGAQSGLSRTDPVMQRGDASGWHQVARPGDLRGAVGICIDTGQPHLAGIELTELPLTTAAAITPDQRHLIRDADALIWVTIAAQAWRLSERQILDALEDGRPARAIIVMSRGDKLRSDADLAKLQMRVTQETRGYFDEVLVLKASRVLLEEAGASDTAWQASGGRDLAGILQLWAALSDIPDVPQPLVSQSKIHQVSTKIQQSADSFAPDEDEVSGPASRVV